MQMNASAYIKTIKVSHDLPVDLHFQVSAGIESLIRKGLLPRGERLPSVRDLATICGVSLTTAMRAMRELSRTGLVTAKTGAGTYVAQPLPNTTDIMIAADESTSESSLKFFRQINEGLEAGYNEPGRRFLTTFTNGHSYTLTELLNAARARACDSIVAYARGEALPAAVVGLADHIPCVCILPKSLEPKMNAVVAEPMGALRRMLQRRFDAGQRHFAYLGHGYSDDVPDGPDPYVLMSRGLEPLVRGMGLTPIIHHTTARSREDADREDVRRDEVVRAVASWPRGCTILAGSAGVAHRLLSAYSHFDIVAYTESRDTAALLRRRASVLYMGLELAARAAVPLLLRALCPGSGPVVERISPVVIEREESSVLA